MLSSRASIRKNVSQVMTEDPEGIGQSSGDPFWKGRTSELPQALPIHPLGESSMNVQEVDAEQATERTGKASRREKRGTKEGARRC